MGDNTSVGRKAVWADDETWSICFQTAAPGVSVAHRYAVNTNAISNWLRDPRYTPDLALVPYSSNEARFLPVEIVAEANSMTVPATSLSVLMELPSSEACIAAVKTGTGATVLSLLAAASHIAQGLVVEANFNLPVRTFSVLTPRDRQQSRAALAFIAQMAQVDGV